jgi:hypothetical protein
MVMFFWKCWADASTSAVYPEGPSFEAAQFFFVSVISSSPNLYNFAANSVVKRRFK